MIQMSLPVVLQALCAHEINCGVACFRDDGWTAWIGDGDTTRRVESRFEQTEFHEIPDWMLRTAQRLYPTMSTH